MNPRMVLARGYAIVLDEGGASDGYSLRLVAGKVQFNLVKRWLDDAPSRADSVRPGAGGAGITSWRPTMARAWRRG